MAMFFLIVLIMSAVVHEYMHGWAANELGDETAKNAGRLTLNPLVHLDPVGSFLLPLILYISTAGAFVFGYAKPVPYNPYNLKDLKYGPAKVAAAGPLANLAIAVFCGLVIRFVPVGNVMFFLLLQIIVQLNLVLMVFNMIPIPPLDGSKIILPFLPVKWQMKFVELEKYGFIFALAIVMFAFPAIVFIVNILFRLIVGF
jgi:Zn-dependent protease